MSFTLAIILNSFWSFLGTCILIAIACDGIATIVKSFKGK